MHFVTFCTPDKKYYRKEISQDATIEEAKKIFCEETSECNLQSIKMIYNKQVLHDSIVISSLELKENDFILVLINSKQSISKPESQIPETKPLPFKHKKPNQKLHTKGPIRLTVISKKTKQVKFLTIMPSDMHKKKYKKLILRAKRDSKKINNSPETKTHVTHIMQSAIQSQNIVYQTSSSRKIFRKRRTAQNINNTSNRLYFLPTNFSNKRLHIHHDHLLRRTSNCIHSLIILSNILFIRYVCKFLFRLICCYFLLVYHIFPF